ncbi:MAG: glycosyltransferase family 4 protein [Candidatus Melainabacteria bacterium]|nr:glycosyltransferase family 4 protein [Candidatus Melainabacteria bacterium]
MRICLISREYPPDTGFGGIATFAKHLAHGLKQIGHEVEVVSLAKDRTGTFDEEGITVHRVDKAGITRNLSLVSRYIPYSQYSLGAATALWARFLELHRERPFDVADTPELLAEGVMPAITKAVPLLIRLYTPHSKFIAEEFHNVTPSFDHQLVAMLERVAMLNADVITSPSEDLADFVSRDLGYPREAIKIIRNPIDTGVFSPEGEKAIEPDGRLTVMFIGRLEERKGISYLVDAVPKIVREFDNVRFVIIGDDTKTGAGQRSVLEELKERLQRTRCTDSVQFIDRVPLTSLPSYYRSADISIVPSVYDNSPYTCLEAMSCGNAVVGTSAGGTREYLVDGESGVLIPPKDSEAIAAALLSLLRFDAERHRLGSNARKRVLENFDRSVIAGQTAALYEKAIAGFASRYPHRQYRKSEDQALPDADGFLRAFDKMLYDEMYRHSFSFRLCHWRNQIVQRPRLSLAKLLLRCLVASRSFRLWQERQGASGICPESRERY